MDVCDSMYMYVGRAYVQPADYRLAGRCSSDTYRECREGDGKEKKGRE
jgi:hypothetical protein